MGPAGCRDVVRPPAAARRGRRRRRRAVAPPCDALTLPQETHLPNMRQLTFDGENAEAYFSFDGKRLTFPEHAASIRAIRSTR